MKKLVLVTCIAIIAIISNQNSIKAQIPNFDPTFIGVHPFTGNIVTDPYWNSTVDKSNPTNIYDSAIGISGDYTNSSGTPTMWLSPLLQHHKSDLFTIVTNDFDSTGTNPRPHNFNFWHKGIWMRPDKIAVSLMTLDRLNIITNIDSVTNVSVGWTEESYTVAPLTNKTMILSFLFAEDLAAGSESIGIDAVEWYPINPVVIYTNGLPDTNFMIFGPTNNGVVLKWNLQKYSGYSLTSSTNATGPYSSGSYSLTTNYPYVSTSATNNSPLQFFRLQQ